MTEPGLEPTTSGLEKPALLSTWLNAIIGNTKYEGENYNIQTAIIQNKSYDYFKKISPDNLLIVLYKLIKVSSLYL